MGGDCLNVGCVPSKSLIAAAAAAHAQRDAGPFGVAPVTPQVDFAAVHRHVHGVIAAIAPHDSVERFEALGVTVIREQARFTAPDTVEAGGQLIRARRFVIATGSRPAVPPVPGLAGLPHLTNETVFDLDAAAAAAAGARRRADRLRAGAGVPPAGRRGDGGRSGPDPAARTTRS